ncbi:hypothetical protein V501_02257 [Pseudogymnoascus sp. VKM F-4519 (FW-2642)]|nr:hypothetical protein V501_02257 [Pseudogymnoascus sp. VKM F-4519 (FW-2642)]
MTEALWYNKPATTWSEGLPVGNGRIGAVVISDIDKETWSFNEITFWSGRSEPSPQVYGGKAAIKKIQTRYLNGDFAGGKLLAEQYLQPPKQNYGTNLTVAKIHLEFDQPATPSNFRRELKLDEAVATCQYILGGHNYRRETFVSHPQQILVSEISTDSPQGLSLAVSISSENPDFIVTSSENTLEFQAHARENIHSDGTCGVRGRGVVKISVLGASAQSQDGRLIMRNATSILVYVAFNTDFRQANNDWMSLALAQLKDAQSRTYEQLKRDHMKDHQSLYRRVAIDLGNNENASLPTNERQSRFKASDFDDPSLFALYFQYGRYLTISGTRTNSPLPLHLQGLWNDGEANRMNWSCDYHLDINTQMNYFLTEMSNLSECHVPLMNYIENLAKDGKSTAEQFYGSPGWVAHVFSNVWGFTDPGWETGWGLNVTGGLWIATHMIEHYEYTQDRQFLVEQAFPALKKSAEFYLDYMVIEPVSGHLVTGPSVSPENSFFTGGAKDGEQQLCLSPTVDIVLIRDLFNFLCKAARLLNTDVGFSSRLENALAKLPPFKIGNKGQLQEWLEDYEEAQPDHRHLSHTIALCRSDQITPRHTPELAESVRVTLANRQARVDLEDIEFTAALFALNFTRLNDGEAALDHVGHLIGDLSFDNLLSYSKAGVAGAENSIFVIDGNFGGAAVLGEMLLRSSNSEVDLLPALPEKWPTGSVKALRARSNLEFDIEWQDGNLTVATLKTFSPGSVTLYYKKHKVYLSFIAMKVFQLGPSLELL